MRRRWPVAAWGIVSLALIGGWGTPLHAATTFSNGSLTGRWMVQVGPAVSFAATAASTGLDTGNVAGAARQHVARIGIINWDGSGGADGRFIALTDNNAGQTMTIDYTWTGTYFVNPDGTGTLAISAIDTASCTPDPPPEGGACGDYVAADTFALSVSKRYGSIALIEQPTTGDAKILLTGEAVRQSRTVTPYYFTKSTLTSRWQLQLSPAMSFAAIAPGDPGDVLGAPRQNVMRVGYLTFDGVGNIGPSSVIAHTEDIFGNPIAMQFQWIGTYSLGSDGIGTLSLTPVVNPLTACTPPSVDCGTFQTTETYAFVASKSLQRLLLIQTNNTRGGLGGSAVIYQRGTAQRQ